MIEAKRIIVTGGAGFLGSHLVRILDEHGVQAENIFVPRSRDYDLRDQNEASRLFDDFPADIVFHLATTVAGMRYNRQHPGSLFYDNLRMGLNVLEQARRSGVEKFIETGSALSYPQNAPIPLKEEYIWNGYPEKTLAPFGIAMRALSEQIQAYGREYGFNAVFLIPANLYGPGDTLDIGRAHVIPQTIMKIADAMKKRERAIQAWGTGKASREFLYVEDAARGLLEAAERYDKPEPMNLGSGIEISIKRLYETLASLMGYDGEIQWDSTKPEGDLRRCLDSTRARKEIVWEPKVGIEEGLRKTVDWYKKRLFV